MIEIVAGLIWLAVGWLPSRIMKHYIGKCTWGCEDEVTAIMAALIGPFGLLTVLFCRWQFDRQEGESEKIPWGWRW